MRHRLREQTDRERDVGLGWEQARRGRFRDALLRRGLRVPHEGAKRAAGAGGAAVRGRVHRHARAARERKLFSEMCGPDRSVWALVRRKSLCVGVLLQRGREVRPRRRRGERRPEGLRARAFPRVVTPGVLPRHERLCASHRRGREVLQREVADGRGREAVRVLAVVRRRQRRRVVILRGSGVHSAGTQVPRSRARAPVARRAHARAVLGEGTPRLDDVAGEARARGARSGDRARRRDGRAAGVRRGRRAGAGECRRGCAIAGGAREFQQQLRRRVLALQRGQHVWPEARRNRLPWFLRMRRGERRVRPVFGRDPAAEECHGPDVQVFEQLRHAVHRRVVRAR